jgi:hypothetical protein
LAGGNGRRFRQTVAWEGGATCARASRQRGGVHFGHWGRKGLTIDGAPFWHSRATAASWRRGGRRAPHSRGGGQRRGGSIGRRRGGLGCGRRGVETVWRERTNGRSSRWSGEAHGGEGWPGNGWWLLASGRSPTTLERRRRFGLGSRYGPRATPTNEATTTACRRLPAMLGPVAVGGSVRAM